MERNVGSLITLGLAILVWAGGAPGCGDSLDDHVPLVTVSDEKPVPATVTRLRVAAKAGNVQIVGVANGEVRVEAKVKVREDRLDEGVEPGGFEDHVDLEVVGETLRIADAHMAAPDKDDWLVSFVIHVPSRLAAEVSLAAGRIKVEGMRSGLDLVVSAGEAIVEAELVGRLTVKVDAGSIDVRVGTVTGEVDMRSSAGQVLLDVTDAPPTHDVRLEANAGSVVLALPKGAPGTFKASSTVGSISTPGGGGLQVTRSGLGATAEGTVGQGGPTYRLTADVGNVTIR